jgi:hypothetical protein
VIDVASTSLLDQASLGFVAGVTVLLVALAVLYGAIAVKKHVNTANTVEALFAGSNRKQLGEFAIRRPAFKG